MQLVSSEKILISISFPQTFDILCCCNFWFFLIFRQHKIGEKWPINTKNKIHLKNMARVLFLGDFGRSVNPISTWRGELCPPHYYWHLRIFRTSYGPARMKLITKPYLLNG
jgi:hypothetical protein